MRKNQGITLIALVITIIVLLILAGVSISAITGENGIIVKAKNAKDATRVAQIEEKIELYEVENGILAAGNETTKTIEEFINELEKDGTITSEEKIEILENHTLTIGEQEPIVFPFAKTLVQAFKDGEIQIGDYVSYTPSNLDAKIELDEYNIYEVDETMQWRVLGLNEEENQLLLTSANSMKQRDDVYSMDFLGLSGAAYYDCVDTLDSISSIYHNEELASETRSITIEDINHALGIVVEDNIVYKKSDESKTNIDIVKTLGKSYTYKVGDYALENYLKEYYPDDVDVQALETRKAGDIIESTGYGYKYDDSNIIANNTPLYEMLFEGTNYRNEKDGESAKSYWVASPGIIVDEYAVRYSIGGVDSGYIYKGYDVEFCSLGYTTSMFRGVKPVVVLKPNITIEQINIIPGEYQAWDINNVDASFGHEMDVYRGQIVE